MPFPYPRRILIVDDNERDRQALERTVKSLGYIPILAESGEEALNVIASTPVDVILTDLMIPRMDGIMLLEALRALGDSTPVVILTWFYSIRQALSCVHDLGAFWFLEKPVSQIVVTQLIEDAIKRRKNDPRRVESPLAVPRPAEPAADCTHSTKHESGWLTRDSFAEAYAANLKSTSAFLQSRGASAQTAEECAQSAWEKAWEYRHQLREARLLVEWVNSIALKIFRRFDANRAVTDSLTSARGLVVNPGPSIEAAVDVRSLLKRCRTDRRIILEERIEGWTAKEAASFHAIRESAARGRWHRAIKEVRRGLACHSKTDL